MPRRREGPRAFRNSVPGKSHKTAGAGPDDAKAPASCASGRYALRFRDFAQGRLSIVTIFPREPARLLCGAPLPEKRRFAIIQRKSMLFPKQMS